MAKVNADAKKDNKSVIKEKPVRKKQPTQKKKKPKGNNSSFWQNIATYCAIVVILALAWLAYIVPKNNGFIENISDVRVLSQEIIFKLDSILVSNDPVKIKKNFAELEKLRNKMSNKVNEIEKFRGHDTSVNKAVKNWKQSEKSIVDISKNKDSYIKLNKLALQISENIPEVQVHYNDAINQMLATNSASADQILLAKNQVILAERILRSISTVAGSNMNSLGTADDFKLDSEQFGVVINGQYEGNSEIGINRIDNQGVRAKLDIINEIYQQKIQPVVSEIYKDAQSLSKMRADIDDVRENETKFVKNISNTSKTSALSIYLPALLLLLSLIFGFYALYKMTKTRQLIEEQRTKEERGRQQKETQVEMQRAARIQEENDRNQTAILRLLDELGDLADGDLTVNATVSEDFTGAIADSVNFAIDQLRQLVSAINRTAISVAGSSEDTQSTAMQLAESSEHQAQEIAGASAAINEMAVSIDQVSANAVESATVADRSVAIAYNGAEVVQRTIDGMNTIREQIQETSKRIKRLGESSQEIGDIISLINDIADQTNILALNAAIQASSAGEAGRGFAVVADEVQRLAERSANATKQIESLVKTIQSDTNEAVASMELTTTEVVKGAKLAKDAGEALEEVQTVSNTLADLIQNISNAARQQAASAGHISNTMNIIQEITTQTTAGTIATARSVGQLNEMAITLRESVSGFTLPEEDGAVSLANSL